MSGETLPRPDEQPDEKKFLFNAHDFNAPDPNDVEEIAFVEPTFSKEELAAAKQKAFQKGKQEGIDETNAALTKRTADLLQQIAQHYPTLLMQEDERAALYEAEALRLTAQIFDTLYPLLKTHFAEEELKDKIKRIMDAQDEQSHISISVHPDMVTPIQTLLDERTKDAVVFAHTKKDFIVRGQDNIDLQAVTMKWKDGGATYDAADLAQKIHNVLEESLAPLPANSHDNEDIDAIDATDAAENGTKDAKISDNANDSADETPPDGATEQ